MRKFLLLATASLFISACDMRGDTPKDGIDGEGSSFSAKDFPRENGRIYGGWEGTETSAGSGVKFRLFFSRSGLVGMEMLCETDKKTVRASTTGSAKITDKNFTIVGGLTGGATDGVGCNFTYNPGQLLYYVESEILHTSAPEGSGLNFLRRLW